METVLHMIGLCPDNISHIDVSDYFSLLSLTELYTNIQMIFLNLRIKVFHFYEVFISPLHVCS